MINENVDPAFLTLPEVSRFLQPQIWATGKPPRVLYVAGYRRTGKDTFTTDVLRGYSEHQWEIWSRGDREVIKSFAGAQRVAFGDALWEAVRSGLGLPDNFDYEGLKDKPLFGAASVRDHMIAVGRAGRAVDPGHWVGHALGRFFSPGQLRRVVCSDFRFVNEYRAAAEAGAELTTVRLFRPDVPIPPAGIVSEHDLDSFLTDYLLVPKDKDVSASENSPALAAALAVFPQYRRSDYHSAGALF